MSFNASSDPAAETSEYNREKRRKKNDERKNKKKSSERSETDRPVGDFVN